MSLRCIYVDLFFLIVVVVIIVVVVLLMIPGDGTECLMAG